MDLATNPARIVAQENTRSPQPQHNYTVPASFRTTVHFEEDDGIYSLIPENGTDHFVFDPTLNAYCRTTSTCPDADKLDNTLCNGCASGSVCCAGFSVQTASTPGYYGGSVSVRGLLIPWNTATRHSPLGGLAGRRPA